MFMYMLPVVIYKAAMGWRLVLTVHPFQLIPWCFQVLLKKLTLPKLCSDCKNTMPSISPCCITQQIFFVFHTYHSKMWNLVSNVTQHSNELFYMNYIIMYDN